MRSNARILKSISRKSITALMAAAGTIALFSASAFAQNNQSMSQEPSGISRKDISKRNEKIADAYKNAAKCYDDTAKTIDQCRQMLSQSLGSLGVSPNAAKQMISTIESPKTAPVRGGQMQSDEMQTQ